MHLVSMVIVEVDMTNDQDWLKQLREKRKIDREHRITIAKREAVEKGRETFDLQELKKYWAYRFEKGLPEKELAEDMKKIEEDYYLDNRFKTMESYGKYLMEMELYR